jgi:hypothetical protein
MAGYWLKIKRRIDFLFETLPNAQDDPHEFIREYERIFGYKFPFWYARAKTEFGIVFGRDLSDEDAAWGRYRPVDEDKPPISIEEQIDRIMEHQPDEARGGDVPPLDDLDKGPW